MGSSVERVGYRERFIVNSRKMKLFTCQWYPADQEAKAMIFYCHGYGLDSSTTAANVLIKLARQGYEVYGIDYEGHGKSEGLRAYIKNYEDLVNDVAAHYYNIAEMPENEKKKKFLLGESLGGSVAILLDIKKPQFWDGAVLLLPLCKFAAEIKPPQIMMTMMKKFKRWFPTWKAVTVSGDAVNVAIKSPIVRQQMRENQYCYKGRLRMRTGYEFIRLCIEINPQLHQASFPFIVLHGGEDRVTDVEGSKKLHEVASSEDKTIKVYPEMWHNLLVGEMPPNAETVYCDIVTWLKERTLEKNVNEGSPE